MITQVTYPFQRHELAIATIDNNGKSQYKFDRNELLNNKKVKGIAFYKQANLATDPNFAVNGATNVVVSKSFLTLKTKKGVEILNKIPVYSISSGLEQPDKFFPLKDLEIDWEQSYFTVPAGLLNNTEVLLLGVFFEEEC